MKFTSILLEACSNSQAGVNLRGYTTWLSKIKSAIKTKHSIKHAYREDDVPYAMNKFLHLYKVLPVFNWTFETTLG